MWDYNHSCRRRFYRIFIIVIKEIKNKYGLQHTNKELIGYSIHEQSGGDGVEEIHSLVLSSDWDSKDFWYVDDPRYAEWVRLNSTEWYNANHETPINPFNSEDLTVVKITISITAKPVAIKIPTAYQVYKAKYAKTNKDHWKDVQELLHMGVMDLGYYELIMYYENQQKHKQSKAK